MTTTPTTNPPRDSRIPDPSRRRFLTVTGLGAAAGMVGLASLRDVLAAGPAPTDTADSAPGGRTAVSGGVDPGLIIVSIQLSGGLDFLNTVVPVDDQDYARIRGEGTLTDDEARESGLIRLDDDYALHAMPHLADRWHAGDLAIVHGGGWEGSSLSHFDATDMWEKGSPDFGTTSGWLGRALRDLGGVEADPLLAVSVGGVSPTMYADGWSPVGLAPDARIPWSADFRANYTALDRALTGEATGGASLLDQARDSQLALRGIGSRLGPVLGDPEHREFDDEGSFLDLQLDLVAQLIDGDLPTLAFHVSHDGYDPHVNQLADLPRLLEELDTAIQRVQTRLGPRADRVVIATWTEFGRRPDWNGEGTEHGTAGVQFVIGPRVKGGHHGEPPPMDRFDADENFLVTTDFRDYLSGLTLGTLGVDPDRVVDGGRGPLDLVEA